MAGDVQSLDAARRARDANAEQQTGRARLAGADARGVAQRAATANVYVTRAEEALAMLSGAGDDATRAAFRRITESWLELATAELSALPASA